MNEHILYLSLFLVLALLVTSNTYNLYRLSTRDFATFNLMDMQEMSSLHPIIKEIYREAVVKGFRPLQNKIINDFLYVNNADEWYKTNKTDLIELLDTLKSISYKEYNLKEKTSIENADITNAVQTLNSFLQPINNLLPVNTYIDHTSSLKNIHSSELQPDPHVSSTLFNMDIKKITKLLKETYTS